MSGATVPLSTMVPISVFSRGQASQAFSQIQNGQPVTVLRTSFRISCIPALSAYAVFVIMHMLVKPPV